MATYTPTKLRWWYPAIADWMLRNPGGDMVKCAKDLDRSVGGLRMITSSDMFKEYYAQRRREWQEAHDFAILSRVNQVATKSLDLVLDKMERKGDQVPMNVAKDIAFSALDRLGYAPQNGPQVTVNTGEQKNVFVAVTPDALEEARTALRLAESGRGAASNRRLELTAEVVGSEAVNAGAERIEPHRSEVEEAE